MGRLGSEGKGSGGTCFKLLKDQMQETFRQNAGRGGAGA